ncbi:SHOCT domain-containing protein [Plantactinospora siamensis]|uniref:SHOCT domain-containing protein n=1 Tax=Plantactinospora siamensis TaxID=555372 RepID=A0ABV6NSA0_9ACTN
MAAGMWLWSLLLVVALLVLGYFCMRLLAGAGFSGRARTDGEDTARRILDERYARGDIDEEEYRRRRDVLR